ncbi:hypothetical protein A9A89_0491 [Bifidobacterium psychraerophilum DSM 22366]|nr:hypothetical protein A9A89_0491 [Bifidobacterium psychraerophilum DSM 22366]
MDGNVQSGCRFISYQEIKGFRKGTRYQCSLTKSSRKLMRILTQPHLRFRNTNIRQQLDKFLLFYIMILTVFATSLSELISNCLQRIQRF